MAVLYVKEQGALLQKCGERLVITKGSHALLEIPVIKIEDISLIGNVQITTQAMHMLMQKGVDISYFSYGGRYLGHTAAESSKNIFLRFGQYQFYLDEERRLGMAKTIIDTKIRNQMELIRQNRHADHSYDWNMALKQMNQYRLTLDQKKTPNEILGVEGICSNIYFQAFSKMLKGDFMFQGRNRRPPKDPVNAIISLAYTFLTKEMCSALDAESFETYLGFLHGIRYGRKSLALDMIEEFRQPIVDRLVLQLFNKRMLSAFDFEFPEDGGVLLNEDGFRKFCTEYERWMTGQNSVSGEKSFRACIRRQVSSLKKSISNGEGYIPYHWGGQDVRH